MRTFTGEVGKRNITLGGRSRKEETREEVLERTRQERERRRQAKLEQQAATTIQSHWRGWRSAQHAQRELRQAWAAQYGDQGQAVDRASLSLSQPCLPALLMLSTATTGRDTSTRVESDVVRLVAVCRALLQAATQPGGLAALLPALQPNTPHPAPAAASPVSRVVHLLARLAAHCLAALNYLAGQADARQQLALPRPAPAQLSQVTALPSVVTLGETLLLLASPDSWGWVSSVDPALNRTSCAGPAAAVGWAPATAAAAVLSRLVLGSSGGRPAGRWRQSDGGTLIRKLGKLLLLSRQQGGGGGGVGAGNAGAARPYAEVLTTQLVVRALALKRPGGQGLLLEQVQPTQGVHLLLCVPDLWSSAPSLAPVVKHLVRLAACSLAATPTQHMARSPSECLLGEQDGQPYGPVASAAALLINLTLGGSKALAGSSSPALTALQLCIALNRLLGCLPLQLLTACSAGRRGTTLDTTTATLDRTGATLDTLDGDPQGEEDMLCELHESVARCSDALAWQGQGQQGSGNAGLFESSGGTTAGRAAINSAPKNVSVGVAPSRMALPQDQMLPSELSTSMQVLFEAPGRQLLWELVSALLPLASATDAAVKDSNTGGTPSLERLPGARELCRLIRNLAAAAPNRQHMHISLALSMGFVPRMWWSVLRPLRAHQLVAGPVPASAWHLPAPPALFTPTATGLGAQLPAGTSQQGVGAGGRGGGASVGGLSAELDALGLLCSVYMAHLAVADVGEFFAGVPLPLTELYDKTRPSYGLLVLLKDTLWSLLWNVEGQAATGPTQQQTGMASSSSRLGASGASAGPSAAALAQQAAALQRRTFLRAAGGLYCALYDRNGSGIPGAGASEGDGSEVAVGGAGGPGRQFCPPTVFHASNLGPERFAAEAAAARASQEGPSNGHLSSRTDLGFRIWQVLQYAPALVPFEERARLFQAEVSAARTEHMEGEMRSRDRAMMTGNFQPNQFVTIHRDQLLFDGFDKLGSLPAEAVKGRVRVAFIDAQGAPEAGVDGGGLFKDFMEGLIKEGFGGDTGLFLANAHNELYPNPASYAVVPEAPRLLSFLGRMLGKALWEGILLELPLARFFLKKLRGGRCELRDLPSLDQQLYSNLTSLKQYQGDLSELSLTFTATHEVFGAHSEVELKPGGSQVIVTSDNVGEYIARVADFRLNVEPARACAAFIAGFNELVRPEWVGLFNETELQMLISGRMGGGGLDLMDLRMHANYAGGYHDDHPVMAALWEALESFTPQQQHMFLKFVTACSRAPLLGFKYLEPGLCVQMAGSVLDPESTKRLPTAATCMNLLKLPPYNTVEMMRDKLLTAIMGATTFDLS